MKVEEFNNEEICLYSMWICHEGDMEPAQCPVCKVGADKFMEQSGDLSWADEHRVGVAKDVDPRVMEVLQANFIGEVVVVDTKVNLQARVDAEHGACQGKMNLAKLAKELNLDAVHDTVHEMCKDEARHGQSFKGLLDRYLG